MCSLISISRLWLSLRLLNMSVNLMVNLVKDNECYRTITIEIGNFLYTIKHTVYAVLLDETLLPSWSTVLMLPITVHNIVITATNHLICEYRIHKDADTVSTSSRTTIINSPSNLCYICLERRWQFLNIFKCKFTSVDHSTDINVDDFASRLTVTVIYLERNRSLTNKLVHI